MHFDAHADAADTIEGNLASQMHEQGMTWHLMHDVWERGITAVMADAIARAGEGCDALYLSVDIDVLDPARRRARAHQSRAA